MDQTDQHDANSAEDQSAVPTAQTNPRTVESASSATNIALAASVEARIFGCLWPWLAAALVIIGLLALISIANDGFGIIDRFRPSPAMRAFRAITPAADNETLILLADFTNAEGVDPQFVTDDLFAQMAANLTGHPDLRIERLQRPITATQGSDLARNLADAKDAAIVIWGYYASPPATELTVHMDIFNPDLSFRPSSIYDQFSAGDIRPVDRTLPEASMLEFKTDLGNELSGLIAMVLGISAHRHGRYDDAQAKLHDALQYAVSTQNLSNATLLSDTTREGIEILNYLRYYRGTNYLHMDQAENAKNEFDSGPFSFSATLCDPASSDSLYPFYLINAGSAYLKVGGQSEDDMQLADDALRTALTYYQCGQEVARSQELTTLEAQALRNMGYTHAVLGNRVSRQDADTPTIAREHAAAVDAYQLSRSLTETLARTEHYTATLVATLVSLGDSHFALSKLPASSDMDTDGHRTDALETYRHALSLAQGDAALKPFEAQTLSNLGQVYFSIDEMEQSLRHYQEAMSLFVELGDEASEGAVLVSIGDIHCRSHQLEDALTTYEDALQKLPSESDFRAQVLRNIENAPQNCADDD